MAQPKAEDAVDGVFVAFQTHPVVAIGDWHGAAEEGRFYLSLIRDPRFATTVRNLVVEWGGAARQDIIDRYVAGEPVAQTDLRRVWTDVVDPLPIGALTEYQDVFAAVRSVNARLPQAKRIRVWLGDPAIDWSTIHNRADFEPLIWTRDEVPAALIEREILAKRKKALVIYGAGHLRQGAISIDQRLEAAYPHSVFVATAYLGFHEAACETDFGAKASAWSAPLLVPLTKGAWPQTAFVAKGCTSYVAAGMGSDALLYLGPPRNLTESPLDPDFYLDLDYFSEMNRRSQLVTGQPLDHSAYATYYAAERPRPLQR